jgi:DNA polymerase-1
MNIPFTIVRSPEDFPSWIAGNEFGFDTETTGLDYATDTIVGISLSCKGKNYYIPVIDHDQCLPTSTIIDLTTKLFTHPDSVAIGHNSKFDTKMLLKFGIQITCKVHDTLLAAWLLNEKRGQHGLKYLEKEILGFTPPELNFNRHTALNYALNTVNAPEGQRTLPGMEGHRHSDQLAEYAAIDAFGTYAIWKTKFEHELGRFTHLYDHLELPYSDVLRRMEMRGTYLNRDLLRQWRQDLEHRDLPRLREHIYKEAGTRFNIESNSELAHILFDVRKLPVNKYTGKGQRAVDKEVLQEFADHYGDPLPAAILEYRALQKILSTYVIPLYDKSPYGRVHCSFNQTGTVTGRLSSSEPNLQNVVTRKDGDNYNIRQAFIPTPGYGMVVVDYSALELRVLSHFILEYWGDESALVHAIQQGLDAHTYMASVLYNQPYNTVTKDQRSRTKSLTFGLMYGMGPKKLAKSLNLSYSSARSALDDYFKQFPDIRYVQNKLISQAKYDGVVRTILGHERRFTSVEDSPETEGLNALIQGSAADIVKLAQIKIDQQFTPDMHQLIQVHDEVVCEAPLSQIQACADIVQYCMENAYPLNVPLVAEPKIVSNWSEAK